MNKMKKCPRKPRHFSDLKRNKPQRSPSKRILIVCEGEKTEPNYFEEIRKKLELVTTDVVITGDCDSSPDQVLTEAEKLYKESVDEQNKFDLVFCVFDKDSHKTYQGTIDKIKKKKPKDIFKAITSDPCFEYWYILHFTYTTKPYTRSGKKSPGDLVVSDLKNYIPKYDKGKTHYYEQLKGKLHNAIIHAKRSNDEYDRAGGGIPTTKVHELIEWLLKEKDSNIKKVIDEVGL